MRTIQKSLVAATLATVLSTGLAGCGKSEQPTEVAPPPPSPAEATPAPAPAPDATAPAPTETPAAPAQPAPAAPAPTEPSAVPTPTAGDEPPVSKMLLAQASGKLGVPVDLHYSFDGAVLAGQPVTLHLAAVPRYAGANLRVNVQAADGVRIDAAPLSVQKVAAAGEYRQQVAVTRSANGPAALRVLISLESPDSAAFGYFTIPLDESAAQKQTAAKQR